MGEVEKIIQPSHQTTIGQEDGSTGYERIEFLGTSTGGLKSLFS